MEGFEMAFALGRSVLGPAIGGAVLGGMAMLAGKMLSNKRNIHQPGDGAAVRSGEGSVRRSEEHTSELQSLMRISYAVFCLKKKKKKNINKIETVHGI